MNGVLEPHEDAEMDEMKLPSRHRFRNSSPGDLRLSSLSFSVTEAPHNIESLRVSGELTLCFFETCMPERRSSPRSPTFQAGSFNHSTRASALRI